MRLHIEDDKLETVITEGGFETETTAKIVHEEIFYNDLFKPFRVMVLNRSLILEDEEEEEEEEKKNNNIIEEPPTRDVTKWLQMIPQIMKNKLRLFLEDMRYRYVYVPEIESARRHALNKIEKEIERTTPVEDIRDALEHYVFCELHDVIFSVIRERFSKKESVVRRELMEARRRGGIRPDEVGLQSRFHGVKLDRAAEEMKRLCEKKCPLSKIQCIRRVGRSIYEELNSLVKRWSLQNRFTRQDEKEEKDFVIAGDDVLPLFVLVVARAEAEDLNANVEYMSNWTLSDIRAGESGFYLANFAAAVQYVPLLSDSPSLCLSLSLSLYLCPSLSLCLDCLSLYLCLSLSVSTGRLFLACAV